MRPREKTLKIQEILKKRGSRLAECVSQVEYIKGLDRKTREAIVDELSDELTAKGLNPNSEPNQYGLEIESLIDTCGLSSDD